MEKRAERQQEGVKTVQPNPAELKRAERKPAELKRAERKPAELKREERKRYGRQGYPAPAALCLALAVLTSGCHWSRETETAYQIQGIYAYKGQSVADLWEANGAPNVVKNLGDNTVMWVYYTNYRPVGGGEIISYNMPAGGYNGGTGNMPPAGSMGTRATGFYNDNGYGAPGTNSPGNYNNNAGNGYGGYASGGVSGYGTGGGNSSSNATSCSVKVMIKNEKVAAVNSDCS